MCRNIRPLANFEPPAAEDEIRDAALQFVRKISGSSKPSRANERVFNRAVDEISRSLDKLLNNLVTNAPPKDRETEMRKAQIKSLIRFGKPIPNGL